MLALVIDINRFVEVYLGPAMNELSGARLVVGLATPEFGVRMGPGREGVAPTPADAHNHVERQGTHDPRRHGRAAAARVGQARCRRRNVAGRVVGAVRASSPVRSGDRRWRSWRLTAMLLVAVPLAGWLIARRERQVQQEQRKLERRLAESQKMEAIGKLAGGVAHDFNNMLTAILGYASMIQEDAPPKSAMRDQALQIRRAAESAAALTQKLLAFSRRQVLQSDPVDFANDARQPAAAPAQRRRRGHHGQHANGRGPVADPCGPGADRTVDSQPRDQRARCHAEGGTLQIAARNAPRPDGERRPDADVKPGDYVQITVTDTGVGMDEATRTRMFEPFFTTKAPGQGHRLGLSTVYGFVRQCGGYIGVLSTPGQGTSIELLLPRAPGAGGRPRRRRRLDARAAERRTETVLVAEDEDGVRQLAVESLERRGYRVLAAASGEEALKLAGAFDGTIHLLLSDVVMPGMKGPRARGATARRAARHSRAADVRLCCRRGDARRSQGSDAADEAIRAGRAPEGGPRGPRRAAFLGAGFAGIISAVARRPVRHAPAVGQTFVTRRFDDSCIDSSCIGRRRWRASRGRRPGRP